ncbi:hypothetical protein CIB84_002494, partial [Bambusicola thoracicus]
LKEHLEKVLCVEGLSLHPVHSVVQCEQTVESVWRNAVMNKDSSCSIFTIRMEICTVVPGDLCHQIKCLFWFLTTEMLLPEKSLTWNDFLADVRGQDHLRAAKLNVVDLAGSRRQSETGTTGERSKEATKINLSLSALCPG